MATAKQHDKFNKEVEKLLISKGAKANEYKYAGQYLWQIDTQFGVVILTVHEPSKNPVFSVFSQFADYEQYKDQLKDISGHWKWNVHQMDANLALQDLNQRLNRIIN